MTNCQTSAQSRVVPDPPGSRVKILEGQVHKTSKRAEVSFNGTHAAGAESGDRSWLAKYPGDEFLIVQYRTLYSLAQNVYAN